MAATLPGTKIFNQYALASMTYVLQQNAEVFNQRSNGAIQLMTQRTDGRYFDMAAFRSLGTGIGGLVNPASDAAGDEVDLTQLSARSVKCTYASKAVRYDPVAEQITNNPTRAGTIFGMQLAPAATLAKANTAIAAVSQSISTDTNLVVDHVGTKKNASEGSAPDIRHFFEASAKLGDAGNRIVCWLMHSSSYYELLERTVKDFTDLFSWGNVMFAMAPTGQAIVATDCPALQYTQSIESSNETVRAMVGLTQGAVTIRDSGDRLLHEDMSNDKVTIKRTFKTQETYTVGVKGWNWSGNDYPTSYTATTGNSINNASNWVKVIDDVKDGPGVRINHFWKNA